MIFERGLAESRHGKMVSFYNRALFFFSCDRWIFYEAIEQRFWEAKCSSVSKFASYTLHSNELRNLQVAGLV